MTVLFKHDVPRAYLSSFSCEWLAAYSLRETPTVANNCANSVLSSSLSSGTGFFSKNNTCNYKV